MKKNKFPFALSFLIFSTILLFITYHQLPQTFFQQDEWQYFGANIFAISTEHPILYTVIPFQGQLTHFFPLGTLLFLVEYLLFKVHFIPYALIGLSLHIINAFIMYLLIKKTSRNEIVAFSSSGLFLINSISHQPVTWIAAGIGTLPSTTSLLLSTLFFIKYLEKNENKYFFITLFLVAISLFFKEISLFIFLFLPIYWILYRKYSIRAVNKKLLTSFLSIGVVYLFFRLALIFFQIRSPQPEISEASGTSTAASIPAYLFRVIEIPLKGVAQLFFPQNFLIAISDTIVRLAYPQFVGPDGAVNPYISQTIVFGLTCYILTICVGVAAFLLFKYFKKNEQIDLANTTLFGLLFSAASLLPFIFIPGKPGYFSIFEPRNLYIGMIGANVLISLCAYAIANYFSKKIRTNIAILLLLLLPLFLFHITTIRGDIQRLMNMATIRIKLLDTIRDEYGTLPKKVIFYTQSNTPYYGLPEEEKILPVQSGFGRMLMVWYQDSERFPGCLYENQFLHGLTSQGYRECEGRGFGYFRDYDKLVAEVRANNIKLDEIIAYSWEGKKEQFTDITQNLRNKIREDFEINDEIER